MISTMNKLGRPIKGIVCDTGASIDLVDAKLRDKMAFIPWQNAQVYPNSMRIGESHGSYVKMIMSEYFNAPQLREDLDLVCLQCLDERGSGNDDMIARSFEYAATWGAEVGNWSLGIGFRGGREKKLVFDGLVHAGVSGWGQKIYCTNGGLVFCAAGNEDTKGDFLRDDINFPALFKWAIGVGSMRPDGSKSEFSSDGIGLEHMMLGEDYYGTSWLDGTSFASPLDAGLHLFLKTYVVGNAIDNRKLRRRIRLLAVHGGAGEHGVWCREHGYGSLMDLARAALGHVKMLREEAGYKDYQEPFPGIVAAPFDFARVAEVLCREEAA